MCKVLQLPRATYYYEATPKQCDDSIVPHVKTIFKDSRNNYGTRKIKRELLKMGYIVSRRKIGRIMKQEGLVSRYTVSRFKAHKENCNNEKIENKVNRTFNNQDKYNVVVSDLTYVRVGHKWHYICILLDLFNREIIGYSAGKNKTSELVLQAFSKVRTNLNNINIFHTDRGNEFKNSAIESVLKAFNIECSLSKKGCPYDNAVAEATYKIMKTEFINNQTFTSLEQLQLELSDYVNWFNNHRLHASLGYRTPKEYKKSYFNTV